MFGVITALAIGFSASWELTLVLMFQFPVLIVVGYFEISLSGGRAQSNKKKLEESGQIAVESIDNIRTVAGLGIEDKFYDRYISLLNGPFWYYSNDWLPSVSCFTTIVLHSSRSNVRGVLFQGLVLSVSNSLLFFLFAAGYRFGAFLVVEDRASYDEVFRYK